MIRVSPMSSYQDLINAHKSLCQQEAKLRAEIDVALTQETVLSEELRQVWDKMPDLNQLSKDAGHLSGMIFNAFNSAADVTHRLKQLDLVKTRVSQCLQRVGDILDLKYCTQNIEEALNNEDYEVASANIHRFLSIDESVIRNSAKSAINGQVLGASSMDEAFAKLHEAESKLKSIVMKKFDEAVQDGDFATVERLFKIFPLLNLREEGLAKFSNFLCSKIIGQISQEPEISNEPLSHINQLTTLFETVAKAIDSNASLLETYYGPGNLLNCVQVLQRECDHRAKRILDDFVKKRSISSILNNIQKLNKMSNASNSVVKVDPKEIDSISNELALISSRCEIYLRFVADKTFKDAKISISEEEDRFTAETKLNRVEELIRNCQLSRILQELDGTYVMLEDYFARESCARAIQMDELDDTNLTSSVLDDVFFIIQKCINRALSCGSLDVLCAVINHSVSLLETTFCDALNDRIKYGFPNTGGISGAAAALDLSQAYNVIQTSRYLQTTGDLERAKQLFLTAVNNLDMASDYINALRNNIQEKITKSSALVKKKHNREKLESCLTDLLGLNDKFQSMIHSGLNNIFTGLIKPRIKSWLDAFASESHLLTDEDFMKCEATDGLRPFTQTFLINLDSALKSMKAGLTSNNYRDLLNIMVIELTKRLETTLIKCNFNELGGFQFDREIRALTNYVSSTTSLPIRDKFVRLKAIADILNFQSIQEVLTYFNSDLELSKNGSSLRNSASLVLTPTEVRQFLKLRADFIIKDIKKIKL